MEYKVSELADKAGVTKRTIHYYISKGLLLPPQGSGVNSIYNDEHLERIQLIKKLQAEYMPLNKIREYIMENPRIKINSDAEETTITQKSEKNTNTENAEKHIHITGNVQQSQVYIRENICDIFEIHYTEENARKYKYIIENVKKYVEKMLED